MSESDLYGPPPEEAEPPGVPSATPERGPLPPASVDDDLGTYPAWLRAPAAPDGGVPSQDGLPGAPPSSPPLPEPESVGPGDVALSILVGVLAAAAGAAVWGLIAKWTGQELPWLAWGVGLVVGGAIRIATGRRGPSLQLVAVLAALGGILLGKYLVFVLVISEQLGMFDLGVLSRDTVDIFRADLADVFSTIDLLWTGLAVGTAWILLVPGEEAAAASAVPEHHSRNPVDRLTRGLPHGLRVAVDWTVTIAGAVAIVLLVKAYVVNPYRIPSSSMEPTLHCARPGNDCEARFSDRVLANRFIYHLRDPKRGEIVVFETPPKACGVGGTFVKRVIGMPGEKLEMRLIRGDGYVFINGRKLDEPYVREDRRQVSSSFGPVTVPKDHYFMMGDNREQSCDSREWGALPRKNVIGKVFLTYWPPQRISFH